MSKLEMFGLWPGVIGLVADFIALITFIVGVWDPSSSSTLTDTSPGFALLVVITGIFLLYGWFSISWYVVRRGLNHIPKKLDRPKAAGGLAFSSVFGTFVFLLPITITWVTAILQKDYSHRRWR